jgi:hypothetical protein
VKPVFVQPNVGRTPLVSGVDWRVAYGERWVVLGRNGPLPLWERYDDTTRDRGSTAAGRRTPAAADRILGP